MPLIIKEIKYFLLEMFQIKKSIALKKDNRFFYFLFFKRVNIVNGMTKTIYPITAIITIANQVLVIENSFVTKTATTIEIK